MIHSFPPLGALSGLPHRSGWVCGRRGGCAVFEHKNKSEEKEPVDAKIVKKKKKKAEREREGEINPRLAALSVGRCLARSDLDGRGGSRNRGGSAVEKQRRVV